MKKICLVTILCLLIGSVQASPQTFREDFETGWANGDTTLCDSGSLTNGWIFNCSGETSWRKPHFWTTAVDDETNHVLGLGMSWEPYDRIAGKTHGLGLTGVNTLELNFKVAVRGGGSRAWVWLATQYQFGYGLSVYYDPITNKRRMNIVKMLPNPYFASNIPFGQSPFFFEKAGQGSSDYNIDTPNPDSYAYWQDDYYSHGVTLGTNDEQFITVHLRLEQTAAYAPVKLTAWHTYGQTIANSSYTNPDIVIIDDGAGAGGVFSADPMININTLAYVAFQSDGDPTPSGEDTFCQLDCINVYNYAPDIAPASSDLNYDGKVNFEDLAGFANDWSSSSILPPTIWSETFATYANGTNGNLAGTGANVNGWSWRQDGLSVWNVAPGGADQLLKTSTSYPAGWQIGGKSHNLDLSSAKEATLKIRVAATGLYTNIWIWLSDPLKNGYGIDYMRFNLNQAGIFKDIGRWEPFGHYLEYYDWYALEGNCDPTNPSTCATVAEQYTNYMWLYLKLEQSAPGQPLKMTLWHTGSNTADSSYENPDMVKWDGGPNDAFQYDTIDLKELTWVGVTASCDQSSGDAPGYNFAKIDEIIVETPTIPVLANNDNFETDYQNGINGTLSPHIDIYAHTGDNQANANGWISRFDGMAAWTWVTEGQNHYIKTMDTQPLNWKIAGKAHNIDVSTTKQINLSFKVYATGLYTGTMVWLSDGFHNGYGLTYTRFNENQLGVIKWENRTVAYGQEGFNPDEYLPVSPIDGSWQGGSINYDRMTYPHDSNPYNWERPGPLTKDVGNGFNGWITLKLRLEQNAPGEPVTITAWHQGSNFADATYSNPDILVIDEGYAGTWDWSNRDFYGSVIDLSNLTHMGLLAGVDQNQGGIPGSNFVMIDDVSVSMPSSQEFSDADFDKNGTVDLFDLEQFASDWLWKSAACCN